MLLLLAAALTIPAEYRGLWASAAADCATAGRASIAGAGDPSRSDGLIRVRAGGIDFFASRATLVDGGRSRGGFAFRARLEEEGEAQAARILLTRRGRRLAVDLDGERLLYVRCPGAPTD